MREPGNPRNRRHGCGDLRFAVGGKPDAVHPRVQRDMRADRHARRRGFPLQSCGIVLGQKRLGNIVTPELKRQFRRGIAENQNIRLTVVLIANGTHRHGLVNTGNGKKVASLPEQGGNAGGSAVSVGFRLDNRDHSGRRILRRCHFPQETVISAQRAEVDFRPCFPLFQIGQ